MWRRIALGDDAFLVAHASSLVDHEAMVRMAYGALDDTLAESSGELAPMLLRLRRGADREAARIERLHAVNAQIQSLMRERDQLLGPAEERRAISRAGVEARAQQRAERRAALTTRWPPDVQAIVKDLRKLRLQRAIHTHIDAIRRYTNYDPSRVESVSRRLRRYGVRHADTAPAAG